MFQIVAGPTGFKSCRLGISITPGHLGSVSSTATTNARFHRDEQGAVAAKIKNLAPMVRALSAAAAAPCSTKKCLLAATLAAALGAAAALAGSIQSTPPCS